MLFWQIQMYITPLSALVVMGTGSVVSAQPANYSPPCNNRCRMNDETIDCWQEAHNYYFHQFVKGINDYASFEIMLKIWHERHGDKIKTNLTEILLNESLTDLPGPFTADDFLSILEIITNKTEKYSDDDVELSCPTPCDYVNTLWMYLFICACIVILLIIPIILLHLYFYRKNFIKYQLS